MTDMTHPKDYEEREMEVASWPVRLSSYRLGELYYCRADNVSPGAWLARTTGQTREEAETKALERAQQLLSRTRRIP